MNELLSRAVTAPSLTVPRRETPFTVVVAGEFNAGKSSVLNLMLRRTALPVAVEDTGLAPISVYPSDRQHMSAIADGVSVAEGPVLAIETLAAPGITSVQIEVPCPSLDGMRFCEISITLGTGDYDARLAMAARADLLIWCTPAPRAWTLTEKSVVDALPSRSADRAILAVTRCDLLRGPDELDAVRTRLEAQLAGRFSEILLLNCARDIADGPDWQWREAGGERLRSAVLGRMAHDAAVRARGPVPGVEMAGAAPTPEAVAPLAAAPEAGSRAAAADREVTDWSAELDDILEGLDALATEDLPQFSDDLSLRLINFLESRKSANYTEKTVLDLAERYLLVVDNHLFGPAAECIFEKISTLVDVSLQLEEDLQK